MFKYRVYINYPVRSKIKFTRKCFIRGFSINVRTFLIIFEKAFIYLPGAYYWI